MILRIKDSPLLRATLFILLEFINISHTTTIIEAEHISGSNDLFLPKAISPTEYQVRIHPIPDGSSTFEGFVQIQMEVHEPTDRIVFHMAHLHFLNGQPKVKLTRKNTESQLAIRSSSYDPLQQMQTLIVGGHSPSLLKGDNIQMSMDYVGTLVNNTFGLNDYSYIDQKGRKRRLLATYFQPVGARRVFPCFDEPALKAKFTLTVGRKFHERILSNMPIKKSTHLRNTGYVMDEFEKSVLMPTNVVAFIIHEFKSIKSKTKKNKRINVWASENVVGELNYVSKLATKTLDELEKLLGTSYPLQKLDIVAMPEYPVPGMENFGLIMSREKSLLSNNFLYGMEWASIVTAHEVSHQWIGNQVTPHWWSHFWISEGFATYLAALVLEKLTPSIEPLSHLVAKYIEWTRRSDDGFESTQLVTEPFNPIESPSKGIHMYHKGAALLRMLNFVLGEDIFMEAIREFFHKFALKSATQDDLVNTLSKAARRSPRGSFPSFPAPLHDIIETWTHQAGYPLVSFTREADGTFLVSQKVFKDILSEETGPSLPQGAKESSWWIPISLTSVTSPKSLHSGLPVQVTWMSPHQNVTRVGTNSNINSWVVANVDQMVYMRANYDAHTWLVILKQLEKDHTALPHLNRAQLVDDAVHLFKTGHLDVEIAMGILQYLGKEEDFFVWKSALDSLSHVALLMKGEKEYPLFKDFLLSKLLPVLEIFERDFPGRNNHMNKKMRLLLLSWICRFHDSLCTERALRSFRIWRAQPSNLRIFPEYATEEFMCTALHSGTPDDWNFAYAQFLDMRTNGWGFEGTDPSKTPEKFLVNALACSQDRNVISRYLENILDANNNLTLDDGYNIFNSLVRSENWPLITMQFFRENFQKLLDRFGSPPAPFITTEFDLKQFQLLGEELRTSHPEWSKNVDLFLEDGKKYAKKNSYMLKSISNWLRRQNITTNSR